MKAVITGEGDGIVGVNLRDNGGAEHLIEMDQTGEITGHEQDGYPDKAVKRTPEGNEHVTQARRFAQYYVFAERGYDTVPPMIHPERLDAIRRAIEAFSVEECMELFGDLYQQMASHHGDTERVAQIPDGVDPSKVLYRKDVYLGVDPRETGLADAADSLAEEYGIDLDSDSLTQPLADLTSDERSTWEKLSDKLGEVAAETDADVSSGTYIDCVSPLYMVYPDSQGREHVTDVEQPLEREPDARFELAPIDPRSREEFKEYLAFNLKCQIRDCFVRMGVQPPEAYRVLGYGRYEAAERYNKVEFYPKYHDPQNTALLE